MQELFVVNGMMRSGTIWISRLLADSLQVACRIHTAVTDIRKDSAIWRLDRPQFIRRVHYYPGEYPYRTPQVIVVRDPRDTAVSQATFYNRTMEQSVAWLAPRWNRYYKSWRYHELVTSIVRYEDVLADPVNRIMWLLAELGYEPSREQVEDAVYTHEFSRMVNYHKGLYGRSGTHKTAMDAALASRMATECKEVMELYGYV